MENMNKEEMKKKHFELVNDLEEIREIFKK